ncbi:hypothetical protein LEP1GSC170_1117 [Leptospira interrogans serovar Bataviae str. HAI135]|nr:hypothetical protein LEP1GSC170_1117 [Leptospira interrogans serovar Bataviae str. HAI135]
MLAYSDYIRNTEETVRIVMEKTQKPKSFFPVIKQKNNQMY